MALVALLVPGISYEALGLVWNTRSSTIQLLELDIAYVSADNPCASVFSLENWVIYEFLAICKLFVRRNTQVAVE